MLSKAASSTIFWVFGMTRPGIELWSPGPLVNTLLIRPMAWFYDTYLICVCINRIYWHWITDKCWYAIKPNQLNLIIFSFFFFFFAHFFSFFSICFFLPPSPIFLPHFLYSLLSFPLTFYSFFFSFPFPIDFAFSLFIFFFTSFPSLFDFLSFSSFFPFSSVFLFFYFVVQYNPDMREIFSGPKSEPVLMYIK